MDAHILFHQTKQQCDGDSFTVTKTVCDQHGTHYLIVIKKGGKEISGEVCPITVLIWMLWHSLNEHKEYPTEKVKAFIERIKIK